MTKFLRTAKAAKECRGQAKLVLDALSTETAQTIPELTAKIQEAGLKTVQAPERITAYYLTIFKKQGIVVAIADETPADDAVAGDADNDDEDAENGDGNETEDETEENTYDVLAKQ